MASKFSDEIFLAHGGDDNHKKGTTRDCPNIGSDDLWVYH